MTRAAGLSSVLVASAVAGAIFAASATAGRRTVIFYAKAARAQFIDHSDDRVRGATINPFNTDVKTPPPTKSKDKAGSRPGDNALFQFTLYTDSSLRRKVGTAVYTCTIGFDHQASCDGTFRLTTGTMIANGPIDFDTKGFTIPIVGGSGSYRGVRGQVSSAGARNGAERLRFVLLR